jgi:hypothetical protein
MSIESVLGFLPAPLGIGHENMQNAAVAESYACCNGTYCPHDQQGITGLAECQEGQRQRGRDADSTAQGRGDVPPCWVTTVARWLEVARAVGVLLQLDVVMVGPGGYRVFQIRLLQILVPGRDFPPGFFLFVRKVGTGIWFRFPNARHVALGNRTALGRIGIRAANENLDLSCYHSGDLVRTIFRNLGLFR